MYILIEREREKGKKRKRKDFVCNNKKKLQ